MSTITPDEIINNPAIITNNDGIDHTNLIICALEKAQTQYLISEAGKKSESIHGRIQFDKYIEHNTKSIIAEQSIKTILAVAPHTEKLNKHIELNLKQFTKYYDN